MLSTKENCTQFIDQLLKIEDLFTILSKQLKTESDSEVYNQLYSNYYKALDMILCMATDPFTSQQVQSFLLDMNAINTKEWIIDYLHQRLNTECKNKRILI